MNISVKDQRYLLKTRVIGVDPYSITTNKNDLPINVRYPTIYKYFLEISSLWNSQVENSERGYNYFKEGWIHSILGAKIGVNNDTIFVVHGKVSIQL